MDTYKDEIVRGDGIVLQVIDVEPAGGYRLTLTFDDDARTQKTVDLEPLLRRGGVMAFLLDHSLFVQMEIRGGTLFWDYDHGPEYARGIDIAPEALYDLPDVNR